MDNNAQAQHLACKRKENHYRANICLFRVNNPNTRKRCEICLKITIKNQSDIIYVICIINVIYKFMKFDTKFRKMQRKFPKFQGQ